MAKYVIKVPAAVPPEQPEVGIEADTAEEAIHVYRAISAAERSRYAEVMNLRMEVEALRALTDCLRRQLAKYEAAPQPPADAHAAGVAPAAPKAPR